MTSVCKSREFAETIRELCTAYGRYCDETTYSAYLKGLSGLDMAAVKSACDKWLIDGKKMPCPSEIRDLVAQRQPVRRIEPRTVQMKELPSEARELIRATVAKLGAS